MPKISYAFKTAATSEEKCDLCLAAIMEGNEDALQCEGTCCTCMWFHRYCVGVLLSHFRVLSNSDKPFVCLSCSQNVHKVTVCQLQSELAALKAQVLELQATLTEARSNANNTSNADTVSVATMALKISQVKSAMDDMLQKCDHDGCLVVDKEALKWESWLTVVKGGHHCKHHLTSNNRVLHPPQRLPQQ